MPRVAIKSARLSQHTLLPIRLALAEYRLIGTHENPRPTKLLPVLESILRSGFNGPAVSVLQPKHDELFHSLIGEDIPMLSLKRYGEIGVADGHNRLAVLGLLDQLGLLKNRAIPVQLIPAHDPAVIRIAVKSPTEVPLSVDQIAQHFTNPQKTIDPMLTSYFEVRFSDETWGRVRKGQPDVVIARPDFLKLERLSQLQQQAKSSSLRLDELTQKSLDHIHISRDELEAMLAHV